MNKRIQLAIGLTLSAAMLVTACGSDDDSDSGGSTDSDTDTSVTVADVDVETTTDGDGTTAPVESEPADSTSDDQQAGGAADGEPILVGFHNSEGGPISVPEWRIGWEAGLAYVNEELGGVNGRPIESSNCNVDGSPESSIACANDFIEQDVVAAVQGVDIGADAMLPILSEAGIAEIGYTPFGPQQQVDVGHSFFFAGPVPSGTYTALLALAEAGATKVRFFQTDVPSAISLTENIIRPVGEELGLDADTIYYPVTGADWASVVATAVAEGADAIGTIAATEPDCIGMVGVAMSSFDGPVFAGACTAFVSVLGAEETAGTLITSDLQSPLTAEAAPGRATDEVAIYVDRMTAAGHDDLIVGYAQAGFAEAIDLASALRQIDGDITAESVLAGMPNASGDRFMGGTYNCDGSVWPGETACSLGSLIYETQASGELKLVGDGPVDISKYVPAS